jgi:hypothetical protein
VHRGSLRTHPTGCSWRRGWTRRSRCIVRAVVAAQFGDTQNVEVTHSTVSAGIASSPTSTSLGGPHFIRLFAVIAAESQRRARRLVVYLTLPVEIQTLQWAPNGEVFLTLPTPPPLGYPLLMIETIP